MPTDATNGGGEVGLMDSTLADVVRLIWSPASVPQVAMTLSMSRALAAGAVVWFAFIGGIVAALASTSGLGRNADERLVKFVGLFFVGGFIAVCIILPLALYASLDADMTSEKHRARVRFMLLLPTPIVLPLLGRSWLAASEVPVIGSPWWLIAFAIGFVSLLMRGWDGIVATATGDRCTGCGYLLIGLTQTRCPECGRDFYPGQPLKGVGQ